MANNRIDMLKAGAAMLGAVAAASRAMLEYRKFREHREKLEYTRGLQRKAWQQVINGELSSAKVGNVEIKAPTNKKATAKSASKPRSKGKVSATNGKPIAKEASPRPAATPDTKNAEDAKAASEDAPTSE